MCQGSETLRRVAEGGEGLGDGGGRFGIRNSSASMKAIQRTLPPKLEAAWA